MTEEEDPSSADVLRISVISTYVVRGSSITEKIFNLQPKVNNHMFFLLTPLFRLQSGCPSTLPRAGLLPAATATQRPQRKPRRRPLRAQRQTAGARCWSGKLEHSLEGRLIPLARVVRCRFGRRQCSQGVIGAGRRAVQQQQQQHSSQAHWRSGR